MIPSIYFNCKLVGAPLHNNSSNEFSFYPVQHPRINEIEDQFKILLKTIKSLNKLEFKNAIFNIEIDNLSEYQESQITEYLQLNINSKNKFINLSRPNSKKEWLADIEFYLKKNFYEPFLVIMNHDHLFVDYSTNVFYAAIESVFKTNNNFNILQYSHIPEFISKAKKNNFTKIKNDIGYMYKSNKSINWVDCLSVMTLNTLKYIFLKTSANNDQYLGRFDWPGVYFKKMEIISHLFPREFFRHYDGYSHVTGNRNYSGEGMNFNDFDFCKSRNIIDLSNFYYQIWTRLYYFYLRDNVSNIFKFNDRKKLISAIEKSLFDFKENYLKNDYKQGFFSHDLDELFYYLRNRIYFDFNKFYHSLSIDINLKNRSFTKLISQITPLKYRILIKKLMEKN